MAALSFIPIPSIPVVEAGDDIGALIVEAGQKAGVLLQSDDIVVVSQKIVSKAEGRVVSLGQVNPSMRARELAGLTGRDPRLCQLYLDESKAIIEVRGRHVVTLHRLGFVCTGAGIDRSNTRSSDEVVLLPIDPDASARSIRETITRLTNSCPAVIISDSFGSATREGAIGVAIGIAGIRHLEQPENEADLFGRPARPMMNRVDSVAAAAVILMGETGASIPVVVARGIEYSRDEDASIFRLLSPVDLSDSAVKFRFSEIRGKSGFPYFVGC